MGSAKEKNTTKSCHSDPPVGGEEYLITYQVGLCEILPARGGQALHSE